jgi:hypothetical protein
MFVDGKRVGYSGREAWKAYAPDAELFAGHSFGFYKSAYGLLLSNENIFARLRRNAPSQAAEGNLFNAIISNRDPTILYVTLATPMLARVCNACCPNCSMLLCL